MSDIIDKRLDDILVTVDIHRLIEALLTLSDSFVNGRQGEFGMRIPAEPYRDGDLVCGLAAYTLAKLQQQIDGDNP